MLTHRRIEVDSRRVHVVLAGTGRPSVIFETGAGVDASHWARVQTAVAEHTATLSYDRAGEGGSDPLPAQWTLDRLVDDLERVVAETGFTGPYLLVGHSLGGHVVRSFIARHAANVVGLVLVDARPTRIGELCPAWRDWARSIDINPELDQALDQANQQLRALPSLGDLPLQVVTHGIPDMLGSACAPKRNGSCSSRPGSGCSVITPPYRRVDSSSSLSSAGT